MKTGYLSEDAVYERLQNHLDYLEEKMEGQGEVFGLFLYGSQNYTDTLNDPMSDIDTRAVVVPSFRDLILGIDAPYKRVLTMENEEHIECKDVRHFLKLLAKMNVNVLEVLFTKYLYVNRKYADFYAELFLYREAIARMDEKRFLNACKGMMYQKEHALCKLYPSTEEKINKFGFDGKQLSHILRLYEVMEKYIEGKPFKECISTSQSEYLRQVKRNELYTAKEAEEMAKKLLQKAEVLTEEYVPQEKNKELLEFYDELSVDVLKRAYKMDKE